MKLWNIKDGIEVNIVPSPGVPESKALYDALSTGNYALPSTSDEQGNSFVNLVDGEGTTHAIPTSDVHSLLGANPDAGLRLETEEDKFYDTWQGSGIAALAGATSFATFGTSDAFLTSDTLKGIAAKAGTAYAAGEIVGLAASVLATFGGAAAVEGASQGLAGTAMKALGHVSPEFVKTGAKLTAKVLGPAAKASAKAMPYTPVGALSKMSGTLIAELTAKTASMGLITGLAARTAITAGVSGVEGAIWGIGRAVHEKALGDPTEMGELMFADAMEQGGLAALIGGGFAFAGGALGGVSKKAAGYLERKLATWEANGTLAKSMESIAQTGTELKLGISTGTMDTLLRNTKGEIMPELISAPLFEGKPIFGAPGESLANTEIMARLKSVRNTAGETIGAIRKEAQAAGEAIDMTAVHSKLDAYAKEKYLTGVSPQMREINEFKHIFPIKQPGEVMPIPQAQAQIEELGEAWQAIEGAPTKSISDHGAAKAKRVIWQALRDEMKAAVNRAVPQRFAEYEAAAETYHNLNKANRVLSDPALRNPTGKTLLSLAGKGANVAGWKGASAGQAGIGALAGGSVGLAFGGPIGALAGAGIGVGASAALQLGATKAIKSSTDLAWRLSQAKDLGERIARAGTGVDNAIDAWLKASQKGRKFTPLIGATVLADITGEKDTRKAVIKLRGQIASVTRDPLLLSQRAVEQSRHISVWAPETGRAHAGAVARSLGAVQAILNEVSDPGSGNTFQPGLAKDLKNVSPRELEKIGLRIAAVTQPKRTMDEIMGGIATADQINTFRNAYPTMYSIMLQRIALKVSMHTEPLTQHQRLILSQLGLSDAGLPAGFGARSQQVWQGQQAGAMDIGQQSAQQPSSPDMKSLNKTGDLFSTKSIKRAQE